MELRQLKTFLVVADLLNFNQAASKLHLAQSSVSARIKSLEEEVGVPLFDRLGKRVALTESGRMMVRYAKKMVALEEETLSEVNAQKESGGTISIRIPQSLGSHVLPHFLEEFVAAYPRVNLDINTCTFNRLKRELRTGITDVAFLLFDAVHKADLKSEVLGYVNLLFVCSAKSSLAGNRHLTLKDLERETILIPKHDCRYKAYLSTMFGEQKLTPTIFEINSIETIRKCVQEGVGVALLPEFAVQECLAEGRLNTFRVDDEVMETAILLILHKDKWLSQPLKEFIRLIKKQLA